MLTTAWAHAPKIWVTCSENLVHAPKIWDACSDNLGHMLRKSGTYAPKIWDTCLAPQTHFIFLLLDERLVANTPKSIRCLMFYLCSKLWILPTSSIIFKFLEFIFFTVLSLDEPSNFKFQAQPQTQIPNRKFQVSNY